MIKIFFEKITSRLCCELLGLLRNRNKLYMTREEIRRVNISFSELGEDLIVLSYFSAEKSCRQYIYVDVGAFDPISLSTTLLLYKKGWRGINIDANSKAIEKFKKLRPKDYNVTAAISNCEEKAYYYEYPIGAANRISQLDDNPHSLCNEQPIAKTVVYTTTLTKILDSSPFSGCNIDYLNIDCEGYDKQVIEGLNFNKYKPKLITIEAFGEGNLRIIRDFLNKQGYILDAKVRHTLFFVNQK